MKSTLVLLILSTLLSAAEITVEIGNIKNSSGVIQITLFNQPSGFPANYKKGIIYKTLPNSGKTQTITFDSLAAGTYAVAVIHDENRNKALDAGLFGIPKEGYGVSNNIHPKTRAPRFKECSFTLTAESSKTIPVRIKYP